MMIMGPNGKAIAAFGILLLDVPDHAQVILTYAVQHIPYWPTWPEMLQASALFFLVTLPVAWAGAQLIWRVPNQPAAPAAPAQTEVVTS